MMGKTLYLVIERFKDGDAVPVYRRFRDQGRLAPEGLSYVSSWVDTSLERCYQLMVCGDVRESLSPDGRWAAYLSTEGGRAGR